MTDIVHRTITVNGIQMHLAEQGHGELVLLCHGFPESWYSWRHQLNALAEAGFHAVAPDMRGYGLTDCPTAVDQFTLFHIIGDIVGVLDALGAENAILVGHDWGAIAAWYAAMLRPDRFNGVIVLSVPLRPRSPVRPTSVMPQTADAEFYQLYFQEPGRAEAELEADVRASIRSLLMSLGGEAPFRNDGSIAADNFSMILRNGGLRRRIVDDLTNTSVLPAWLTDNDLDFYAAEFSRTGFRGSLDWYRNIDRNWELMAPFAGVQINIPALYIAGERDLVLGFGSGMGAVDNLRKIVPGLRRSIILPGCGHWTQQERSREVNEAMVEFVNSLSK